MRPSVLLLAFVCIVGAIAVPLPVDDAKVLKLPLRRQHHPRVSRRRYELPG